jgi:hypothetical protein
VTESDLARIESALGIELPVAYRKLVAPFPIPAYAGNTDTELWDNASGLIELNRELRAGYASVQPWPAHMYAMGRDDGGSATAIDLQNASSPVWWADRCHLNGVGSCQVSKSFEEWSTQYLADLRSDLEGNAIDPDGPADARNRAAEESARAGCHLILFVAGAAALIVLVVWLALKWIAP